MDESVDPINREGAFRLLEAEFLVRAGTFIQSPIILNSDEYKLASEYYGSKPILSYQNAQLASVVYGWLSERLLDRMVKAVLVILIYLINNLVLACGRP